MPTALSTLLPANVTEAEKDFLDLVVIERENVQPFDSWTSWLRIERPARLTVSRTLPEQAWAL